MNDRKRRAYGSGSIWIEDRVRGPVYVGAIRVNGKQLQRVLGPVRKQGTRDGLSRTQAEKALREFRTEVEQGVDVPLSSSVTLEHLAEAHLKHLEVVRRRKQNTVDGYRQMIELHVYSFFGRDTSVDSITRQRVEEFVQYLLARRTHGTAVNYLTLMHGLMARAVREGWATVNPVAQAERPEAPRQDQRINFLTPDEIDRLLDVIERLPAKGVRRWGDSSRFARLEYGVVLVAAMSGLRLGELRALRWQDCDFDARVIRVRQSFTEGRLTTPKSYGSQRAVPMAPRVLAFLREHKLASAYSTPEDLVFASPESGRYFSDQAIRDRFYAHLEEARLKRVRLHDLRHSYCTALAAAGMPLRQLQYLAGHSTYTTTERYAHYSPDATMGMAFIERAFGAEGAA